MAHDSGLDDETTAGGTPDDYIPVTCHCGRPVAVLMAMTTPLQQWAVGEWPLCDFHAWEALGAAGIDTTAEAVDFDDSPSDDEPAKPWPRE